jgi:hypothetical protein
MNNLAKTLLAANQRRYDDAKNPLKSHGPDHHWRVYQYAVKLAEKLGVSYDEDVLAGAALLHDMAAYYPERTGEEYHEFDHKIAEEAIETTLLRDADKLDVFGPVGVARIIMVRTLKGDTLDEIVADFYTGGHLKRKWEAITTKEARELVRDDYEYALAFFKRLAKELSEASTA